MRPIPECLIQPSDRDLRPSLKCLDRHSTSCHPTNDRQIAGCPRDLPSLPVLLRNSLLEILRRHSLHRCIGSCTGGLHMNPGIERIVDVVRGAASLD